MTMAAVTTTYDGEPPPPRRQRIFEDERWLAFALLVPTMVLLCLFFAYSGSPSTTHFSIRA